MTVTSGEGANGRKTVFINGEAVGEVPATGDPLSDARAAAELFKAKGLYKVLPLEARMFRQACAFATATNILMRKHMEEGLHSKSEYVVTPLVVNVVFALELYLKTLGQIFGKKLAGHSLLRLYNALPVEAQTAISTSRTAVSTVRGMDHDVAAILTEISDAFVTWRYSYEKEMVGAFRPELALFMGEVLHNACVSTGKV